MTNPSGKLYRLRGIFVVYFVVKSLAGAVVAWGVFRNLAEERLPSMRGWTPGGLAAFSLALTAFILFLAWLVFGQLLQRRNWARVLLLVIGWLTVFSAVFTLLTSAQLSEMGAWMTRLVPELDLDWGKLMRFDRVQKVFELLFWGYLISVLQFDAAVRDEFIPPAVGQSGGEAKK